jgi:hypothetical protein
MTAASAPRTRVKSLCRGSIALSQPDDEDSGAAAAGLGLVIGAAAGGEGRAASALFGLPNGRDSDAADTAGARRVVCSGTGL